MESLFVARISSLMGFPGPPISLFFFVFVLVPVQKCLISLAA